MAVVAQNSDLGHRIGFPGTSPRTFPQTALSFAAKPFFFAKASLRRDESEASQLDLSDPHQHSVDLPPVSAYKACIVAVPEYADHRGGYGKRQVLPLARFHPQLSNLMNKTLLVPILFALGTAFFWGLYGPTIGNAQIKGVQPPDGWSPFKPYVFIGVAYLVIAIGGGLVGMKTKGDSFDYLAKVPDSSRSHFDTAKWGFLAGSLGAAGALCLTCAMMFSKGNAALVMPIVFGGAVSVTALVSYWKFRDSHISPWLWGGMSLVIFGVILVAANTPHGHAPTPSPDASESSAEH